MKIIGTCYYANMLKDEKKEQILTFTKTLMKTDIVQQAKHQIRGNINSFLNF